MPIKKTTPTLGVFMPNFNDSTTIGRAIKAIMTQSRPPDRFLIIDDASTDDSIRVVSEYQKLFPQIELIRHKNNAGAAISLNEGWRALDTDYVYGASADDYALPGFFEKAMSLAENNSTAGIIFGKMVTVDEQDSEKGESGVRKWSTPRYASRQQYLAECLDKEPPSHSWSSSTIYRRQALEEIDGFPNELGPWGDTFALRAIGLKYGVCYLPTRCVVWRSVTNSFSNELRSDIKKYFAILRLAADKMRSEKYRPIFPQKHVRRWLRHYRLYLLARYFFNLLQWPIK